MIRLDSIEYLPNGTIDLILDEFLMLGVEIDVTLSYMCWDVIDNPSYGYIVFQTYDYSVIIFSQDTYIE